MIDFRVSINGLWTALDTYGDSPVMTYQVNSLAEFKDRNTDYSQTIKLPKSPTNMRALGLGMGFDSSSDAPYKSYQCQVTDDGVRVTPLGAILYVTSFTKEDIECEIVGAEAPLIEDLEGEDCSTLEGDGFWVKCDISSIFEGVGRLSNGVRMIWPAAILSSDWSNSGLVPAAWPSFIDSPAKVYPHLNLMDVVVWILEHEGFNVKIGDSVADWAWHFMGCVNPVAVDTDIDYYDWQHAICAFETWSIENGPQTWSGSRQLSPGSVSQQMPSGTCGMAGDYFQMEAAYTGSYKLTFKGSYGGLYSWSLSWQFEIEVYDVDGDRVSGRTLSSTVLAPEVSATVSVLAGQTIRARAYVLWTLPSSVEMTAFYNSLTASVTYELVSAEVDSETEEPQIGVTYDLLASLGFSNRSEIVQEFMRLCALTMVLDPVTNTVEFFNMADVLAKASNGEGVDWTDRLAPAEDSSIEYRLDGYAQKNYISLKAADDFQVRSWFHIDDAYLEKEKDLWESKFQSLEIWSLRPWDTGYAETIGNIIYPLYEFDEDGNYSYKPLGAPAISGSIYYYGTTEVSLSQGGSVKTFKLITILTLSFHLLEEGPWAAMIKVLRDGCKTLEAYFALKPQDIEQLDLTRPVWLGQFGHWFYVQKINNYQKDKLTKINLLKIL